MTNAFNKLDFQKNDSLQVIENYCIMILLLLFPYSMSTLAFDQIDAIRECLDLPFPGIFHLETSLKD